MITIRDKEFGGERPLYASHNLRLENVTIHVGESSIKESSNIEAEKCTFEGKYVFWENRGFRINDCYFNESARSSLWYSKDCIMKNCIVDAPKMFRRMEGIEIDHCTFNHGQETLWDCKDITIRDTTIKECDYLGMHCENIKI